MLGKSHYTYMLIDRANGMKYFGVRSCSGLPEDDTLYMSSSNYVKDAISNGTKFIKVISSTYTSRDDANKAEEDFLRSLDCANNPEWYNKMNGGMSFCRVGVEVGDAIRLKISDTLKQKYEDGFIHPCKGSTMTAEQRHKMSIAQTGRVVTQATRDKLSMIQKGHIMPEHVKQMLIERNANKVVSDETKKKLSVARKLRITTYDTKSKTSASLIGVSKSKEHASNISKGKKGIKPKQAICPHCDRTMSITAIKRYHLDKCKLKQEVA